MEEILKAIDDEVKFFYDGDITEISCNYDFLKLYLMRYKKLRIVNKKIKENETIIHIVNDDDLNEVYGSIKINKYGVAVGIKKDLVDEDTNEAIKKKMEKLILTKKGFEGTLVDWVFDDSKIEYSGIEDYSLDNSAVCLETPFNSDCILKQNKEGEFEVVKKISNYPNIKKFNEIFKYHLNIGKTIFEEFFVGEFDEVKYINVHDDKKTNYSKLSKIIKSISFEDAYDIEKELKDIDNGLVEDNSYLPLLETEEDKKNKAIMLNDKIMSLYMVACQKDGIPEENYVINHLEIIDQVIDFMGLNYVLGKEKYNEFDNSYKVPVVYNENCSGWIIIASEGIGLKTFSYDSETDITVDNEVMIFNNYYSGHISSICVIDSLYKTQVINAATGFSDSGILDGEVTIPYEYIDLDDRFNEIKQFHQETLDKLSEECLKSSKIDFEEHYIDEDTDPESIVLKNGQVYIKNNRRGKK